MSGITSDYGTLTSDAHFFREAYIARSPEQMSLHDAAARAVSTLSACVKLIRASGHPKCADVIALHRDTLAAALAADEGRHHD